MKHLEQPTINDNEKLFSENATEEERSFFETLPEDKKSEFRALTIRRILREKHLIEEPKSGLMRDAIYFELLYKYLKKRNEEDLLDEKKSPIYITAYDLGYLSYFNQAGGHNAGDEAIAAVGKILKSNFDKGAGFRWGGDEFIGVTTNINKKQLKKINEKIEVEGKNTKIAGKSIRLDEGVAHISEGVRLLRRIEQEDRHFVEDSRKSRENLIAKFTYDIADRRATINKKQKSLNYLINQFTEAQGNKDVLDNFQQMFSFMQKGAGLRNMDELMNLAKNSSDKKTNDFIRMSLSREKQEDDEKKNKILEIISEMVDEEALAA